ncbi:hypothetical protein [Zoogloea sp. LCSB751]|uniref:hypothetical protein n=1 Tax=Zoogloea sp. LCSB751 TaxID=1965277 RepID=UPI0009A50AC7|nr:hypothetical protein [Zoogloea sp. LCSB751]
MTRDIQANDCSEFKLSTAEFAALQSAKRQTIHKHHSQKGSYYGVRPQKLPSGKLLWPAIRVTLDA